MFIESLGFMLSRFSWLHSVRNWEFATAQLRELKSLGWCCWQILFVDTFLLQIYPGAVELHFSPESQKSFPLHLVVCMNESSYFPSAMSPLKCHPFHWTVPSLIYSQVPAQIPWKFPCQLRGFLIGWTYPLKVTFDCEAQLWTVHFPIHYKLLNGIGSCSIKAV